MKIFLKAILPILVLAGGFGTCAALVRSKPKPQDKPVDQRGVLVEVATAVPSSETVEVLARGTVIPARQVILGPEVGGRVVSMNPALAPGGFLRKGERAFRVDSRDYRLALEQQAAVVNRAETELQIEQSRKAVAEKEWEKFGSKQGGTASPLATRGPQLATARVAVKSARSGLKQARLRISRTIVIAPFNGIIRSRQVEIGQLVSPGTPVATLVGTDAYWVQVSIPVSQLGWFDIPGIAGAKAGAEVEVRQKVGDVIERRTGHVVRLLGDVDPAGRMARILVEIPNPLQTSRSPVTKESVDLPGPRLPLLLNAYVEVAISARTIDNVFVIKRSMLMGGNKVFIMKDDGTLDIRDVAIAWRDQNRVLIDGGIKKGEQIVTSAISGPVRGMRLRLQASDVSAKVNNNTTSKQAVKGQQASPLNDASRENPGDKPGTTEQRAN